jgi:hypothetical protein
MDADLRVSSGIDVLSRSGLIYRDRLNEEGSCIEIRRMKSEIRRVRSIATWKYTDPTHFMKPDQLIHLRYC